MKVLKDRHLDSLKAAGKICPRENNAFYYFFFYLQNLKIKLFFGLARNQHSNSKSCLLPLSRRLFPSFVSSIFGFLGLATAESNSASTFSVDSSIPTTFSHRKL